MRSDTFARFVLEQLEGLDGLTSRRMFGGCGLYAGDRIFGIIFDGRLYLKTDDASRHAYREMGMNPFRPSTKQTLNAYYEVPGSVLEEPEALVAWARRAVEVGA